MMTIEKMCKKIQASSQQIWSKLKAIVSIF